MRISSNQTAYVTSHAPYLLVEEPSITERCSAGRVTMTAFEPASRTALFRPWAGPRRVPARKPVRRRSRSATSDAASTAANEADRSGPIAPRSPVPASAGSGSSTGSAVAANRRAPICTSTRRGASSGTSRCGCPCRPAPGSGRRAAGTSVRRGRPVLRPVVAAAAHRPHEPCQRSAIGAGTRFEERTHSRLGRWKGNAAGGLAAVAAARSSIAVIGPPGPRGSAAALVPPGTPYNGEIFPLMAHPWRVSGAVDRVNPGSWIATPELGALLRRHGVLARLQDKDAVPARKRGRPVQS